MALSYTRLLCRQNIDLRCFRAATIPSIFGSANPNLARLSHPARLSSAVCESHDEKNMRLKRPMSPHLTIYQVQLTAFLSITHRATGMILTSYAMLLGLGTLFIPGGIPCLIENLAALQIPAGALFLGKACLALPATYHTVNGFRHLAWDLGMFLTIKQVYSTGYLSVGLAAIAALGLAMC